MESTNDSIEILANLEGNSLPIVGDTYRITIGSEQTSGAYSIVDMHSSKCGPTTSFS